MKQGSLRLIDGHASPLHGWDLCEEVVALLETRLPDVSPDDPYFVHLENLRLLLGALPVSRRPSG